MFSILGKLKIPPTGTTPDKSTGTGQCGGSSPCYNPNNLPVPDESGPGVPNPSAPMPTPDISPNDGESIWKEPMFYLFLILLGIIAYILTNKKGK